MLLFFGNDELCSRRAAPATPKWSFLTIKKRLRQAASRGKWCFSLRNAILGKKKSACGKPPAGGKWFWSSPAREPLVHPKKGAIGSPQQRSHWFTQRNHWFTQRNHWVTQRNHWFTQRNHWFTPNGAKTPKSSRNGHPWVEIGRRPYQNDQKSKIYKNPIEFLRQNLKNEGLRGILWIDFFRNFWAYKQNRKGHILRSQGPTAPRPPGNPLGGSRDRAPPDRRHGQSH